MESNFADLEYWVKEREAIRVRKEAFEKNFRITSGKDPMPALTDDPILRDNRFCNVRREDDRGTVWIRNNIREPFADSPHLWFMLCMARMINWPDTLQHLMETSMCWPDDDKFRLQAVENLMRWRRESKQKVWTGAYLIPSGPVKGEAREVYICNNVLGPLWKGRELFSNLMALPRLHIEAMHTCLTRFKGFGQFIAYQACVDMRFTKILEKAPDRATWAAAGPGTIRGLNRLYGRPLDFRLKQDQAREEMREIYSSLQERTGVRLDFSDIPNCACEYDKYVRIRLGQGKMKARYVPGRGY